LLWYNGNSVKTVSDNTGEFYRELETGFYTTTATDIESGCVSDPVVTEILPFTENPEFEISTIPTNCEQNIGGATYVPLNTVEIESIVWDIDGVVELGTIIENLPKGTFSVIATSTASCETTKTFEILPEILVFNGVSRNGDGSNDVFEISCIQDFPNNNVKIFNRNGTLVYEANGYNNSDKAFNGTSNEGLSLLGKELPDGTYFYIITKGDGSRPRTGYLELLRQ
jgi:gliding motility-associated-like protein